MDVTPCEVGISVIWAHLKLDEMDVPDVEGIRKTAMTIRRERMEARHRHRRLPAEHSAGGPVTIAARCGLVVRTDVVPSGVEITLDGHGQVGCALRNDKALPSIECAERGRLQRGRKSVVSYRKTREVSGRVQHPHAGRYIAVYQTRQTASDHVRHISHGL